MRNLSFESACAAVTRTPAAREVKSNVEHPNATQDDLTWQALLYRTDPNGEPVWDAAYGDQSTHLSNAGEFVVATSDGGYAMSRRVLARTVAL